MPRESNARLLLQLTDDRTFESRFSQIRQLCAGHVEDTLFVGSDVCNGDGARKFLRHQLNVSGFKPSAPLRAFLSQHRHPPYVHNAGIIGGRLPVLEQLRRTMAERTSTHYAARPGEASVSSPTLDGRGARRSL